ncbi:hypothetical protein BDV23DRAFT_165782 [Aspergillus alliaceus]|uniref:Uncharacterized protein n=1 Tax=Petromyces alliaceus TaxID=209559 RepID=A0A5N6FF20_PETAA|nr:uncharacterized protein BDW43DRAFT_294053 [Aspergillus alliaceus]KAB8227440.1 hypothetical protein BDW43DRAFT_294053 [Aspergillus alliaceus]KAE8385008.1 hypothetical protein BDV23DRAFT_165782 [Aspergillus alliaceus]
MVQPSQAHVLLLQGFSAELWTDTNIAWALLFLLFLFRVVGPSRAWGGKATDRIKTEDWQPGNV